MTDPTPESAAVRLYVARMNGSPAYVLEYLSRSPGARMEAQRLAAEHERLCSERIAAAEKAARVGALKECRELLATKTECTVLKGGERYLADNHDDNKVNSAFVSAIDTLIAAAQAKPQENGNG